jgi:hypothetical protein
MLGFISYFFGNIASIGSPGIFYYGGFIFLAIYAITDLMDRNSSAIFWETIKNLFGIYLIYSTGDWFGSEALITGLKYFIIAYFVISNLVTAYFVIRHYKEDHQQLQLT